MARKKEMDNYYCVVSSNKTKSGKMLADVIRIRDWILPFNRYDPATSTWFDYFGDREQALAFAKLLRRHSCN